MSAEHLDNSKTKLYIAILFPQHSQLPHSRNKAEKRDEMKSWENSFEDKGTNTFVQVAEA